MVAKVLLIFALLALVMVAESTNESLGFTKLCSNGDCLVDDDTEDLMDSESNHRLLAGKSRYISYGALRANSVPCNRRGQSYYNCNSRTQANPYNRGCNAITNCARRT